MPPRWIGHIVLMLSLTVLVASGCTGSDQDSRPVGLAGARLPHSAKGYEIYSWQANGEWHFTLITGTNRIKELREIMSDESVLDGDWAKLTATGAAAAKEMLNRLPSDSNLLWLGPTSMKQRGMQTGNLGMPPKEIVSDLASRCDQVGIHLTILD